MLSKKLTTALRKLCGINERKPHSKASAELHEPIAIIGAGVTGKSCFDLLCSKGMMATIFDEGDSVSQHFTDDADKVRLGEFHAESFTDFATILLSPGVDARRDCFAAVEDNLLTDIELFARLTEKPIIGVTGSNGKSTVVTLIHEVTQAAGKDYVLCGNIGLPVLQAFLQHEATCDGYIIELSSYHLERAPSLWCEIGVWLNVSPDHLDRYDSYEDYCATKAKLLEQSRYTVVNADDLIIYRYANHCAYAFISTEMDDVSWFLFEGHIYDEDSLDCRGTTAFYNGTYIGDITEHASFAMKDFAQMGKHHAYNIMAVFAVAEKLGIDRAITAQACRDFKPLPSRAVVVGEKNGVTFINDSKGTNIGATVAAISGMSQPIILIAGGQGKGQDFTELAAAAVGRVKSFVLIGEDADVIREAVFTTADCYVATDLAAAVTKAIDLAARDDVVMLSPACASFDMFSSYLKRGETFEELVKEWINE